MQGDEVPRAYGFNATELALLLQRLHAGLEWRGSHSERTLLHLVYHDEAAAMGSPQVFNHR